MDSEGGVRDSSAFLEGIVQALSRGVVVSGAVDWGLETGSFPK